MKGRVERISPVQSVAFDVARSFEDRRGFADSGGGQSFRQVLDRAMQTVKKPLASADERRPSEAYMVNVTRATHSLFYQNGLSLERLGEIGS